MPSGPGWDLLSQAEHGPDSQVVLVTPAVCLRGDGPILGYGSPNMVGSLTSRTAAQIGAMTPWGENFNTKYIKRTTPLPHSRIPLPTIVVFRVSKINSKNLMQYLRMSSRSTDIKDFRTGFQGQRRPRRPERSPTP